MRFNSLLLIPAVSLAIETTASLATLIATEVSVTEISEPTQASEEWAGSYDSTRVGDDDDQHDSTFPGGIGKEEIMALSARSIWDDVKNLWEDGTNVIDNYNCASLPKVSDCCKNKCPICDGGIVMYWLNYFGLLGTALSVSKVSEGQIKAGQICGMPKTFCDQFTQYVIDLPSVVVSALSWIHITVPKYYEAGTCPNGALSTVSTGLAAGLVVVYAAVI